MGNKKYLIYRMRNKICIYHFFIDDKRYHIIYKNRPFIRIKNYLILKMEYLKLKGKRLLFDVKKIKNKLSLKIKNIRKYFHYKYLSLKYKDVDVKGLNIAGDLNFDKVKKVVPEILLGRLNMEFKKLKVII